MQKLSYKENIICHINYRDIFNAPVLKSSLEVWMGILNQHDRNTFDGALQELLFEELIIEKNGYLAVIGKEQIILDQPRKTALTKELIEKGKKGIGFLSAIPFVRYLGISGSLAADNPIKDCDDNHVDLDLFVITARHSMWVFVFIERIFSNIIRKVYSKHFYCFNYVTEESFLELRNQNLYTATELVNLKTLKSKGAYESFFLNSCNYVSVNQYCRC
ncbi:MAG: hypothetical protein ACI93L_003518 [Cyclobacteriaceae bacterium]|jgi:hypothetical protein